MPRLLAAPDKFKGTARAADVAWAIAKGAAAAGVVTCVQPLSDGGEGLLDILGGSNRTSSVTGPTGSPVVAHWRLDDGGKACIEMASAAGLVLAGPSNDPVKATTRGVGELIAAAIGAGAREIVVGCGGSATTDGGQGALDVLEGVDMSDVALIVACDVEAAYLDAARLFAPQKGASLADVNLLTARLSSLADQYLHRFGVDVTGLARAGAAGGLAGGLAALGGRLVSGFELVAVTVGLDTLIAATDFVVTGEGRLDAGSFTGKVVGGVVTKSAGKRVACIAGSADSKGLDAARSEGLEVFDLSAMFGQEAALGDPLPLVSEVTRRWLGRG